MSFASRLTSTWALRSLAINAFGSALDYSTVLLLVVALGLPTAFGTVTGLVLGAVWNFSLNRSVVFADRVKRHLAHEAVRFAGALSILIAAHAVAVWFLRDRLGVPLVLAKMAADFVLLGTTQPFLLRYFVFPRARVGLARRRSPFRVRQATPRRERPSVKKVRAPLLVRYDASSQPLRARLPPGRGRRGWRLRGPGTQGVKPAMRQSAAGS